MSGSFTHMGGTSSWVYFSEQNKKSFHYLEYAHDVSKHFNTGFLKREKMGLDNANRFVQ